MDAQHGDRRSTPGAASAGPARTWSLRREWSRAFLLMLIALLVGAAVTIVGVRGVVSQVQAADSRLLLEMERVDSLRAAVDAHEQSGHRLLLDPAADTAAFAARQQEISALFDDAAADLPATGGSADSAPTLQAAREAWQESLASSGLWSGQLDSGPGSRVAANPAGSPAFAAASAEVRTLLAGVQRSSLAAMDQALAYTADLERVLVGARIGLFAIAVAATFYFRRRMVRDLLRPVESLRRGALKLQAGQYRYRIPVHRRDELGELAEAFNAMADAVHNSHVELTHRATHDSLTGLPNRAALMEHLTASFRAEGGGGFRAAGVLFIDVDDFKGVNDSLGHERGDALLVQLAERLQGCVRGGDLVARLGGDEFAVVVLEDAGNTATGHIANRIHEALRAPFFVAEDRLTVTVSLGAAQRSPETADAAELLREADFAMYMAKHGGKSRYQLFDARGHDHTAFRAALKSDLATAVAARQLRLEYQPVADLRTGAIVGLEAQVRWQHPSLGLLAPADFIPLAEETGDIHDVTCWVLETAARQAAGWRHAIGGCEALWLAVSLAGRQLPADRTLAAVERLLADPALHADRLVLECAEGALAAAPDGGVAVLARLRASGARIAVDGFGTRSTRQGYLLGRPGPAQAVEALLASGSRPDHVNLAELGDAVGA
ncbi:MAG: hypothetical protein JWQ75_2656 [Pseudarthrobacter sp.]|nr:hypothetical protein [Pseudarthrobacter sp.]